MRTRVVSVLAMALLLTASCGSADDFDRTEAASKTKGQPNTVATSDDGSDKGGDPTGMGCEYDLLLTCPDGEIDACLVGSANNHECVKTVACSDDLDLACPQGAFDGCTDKSTQIHMCVAKADPICPGENCASGGDVEGDLSGKAQPNSTTTSDDGSGRGGDPTGLGCEYDLLLTCPNGQIDACLIGVGAEHVCTKVVSCSDDLDLACPTGTYDGCTDKSTQTHMCVAKADPTCPGANCVPGSAGK